jgi:hypothetical protein
MFESLIKVPCQRQSIKNSLKFTHFFYSAVAKTISLECQSMHEINVCKCCVLNSWVNGWVNGWVNSGHNIVNCILHSAINSRLSGRALSNWYRDDKPNTFITATPFLRHCGHVHFKLKLSSYQLLSANLIYFKTDTLSSDKIALKTIEV